MSNDALCNGDFCKLIKEFDVPSEQELQKSLFTYLLDHGAKDGILIGEKMEIQNRTKCPFCRFTTNGFSNSHYGEAPGCSQCFVVLKYETNFWIQIKIPDDSNFGIVMTYGERIVFVNRSGQESEAGRVLDSLGVKYDIVKNWLDMCDGNHQDTCPASDDTRLARNSKPQSLRVVDIRENRLADIPWTERYVALSYVWGDAKPPKLFAKDLEELYTKGSLQDQRHTMPKTIQDVMIFTAGLGLQYLWFDSLCLVQDNIADLKKGIMNMDLIYECAYVTVIAANGSGANSGLPGVGQTPRQGKQDVELLKPGLEIMRVYTLDEHLNKSVWASRGWTMQEHYLSRRTINFVNNQAYFRCRKRIWCEELWTDRDPALQNSGEWTTNLVALAQESMDLKETIVAPHYYLFLAIERFQQRNLTDENDAINAMSGILERVSQRAQCAIIEGLPMDLFPLALNFLHLRGSKPRRRSAFPSWSWAGWRAHPTWYAFNALNFDEHPEEVGDAIRLTCSFFRRSIDPGSDREADKVVWIPERSTLESINLDLFQPNQVIIDYVETQPHSATESRLHGTLSMTAIAVYMSLKNPIESEDSPTTFTERTWAIFDKEDHECGYLYLDIEMQPVHHQKLKLLLLSKCYRTNYPIRKLVNNEDNEQELFWVMFVTEMEDGIYERRGIGHILQKCAIHSFEPGPQWSKLVLG